MQLFTKGQWWSKPSTHWPQSVQWCDLGGRQSSQVRHQVKVERPSDVSIVTCWGGVRPYMFRGGAVPSSAAGSGPCCG